MSTEDRSASATEMMSEATEAAADMLPMDMVKAIAELADPATVAKEMPWLAEELTKIALGQSDISPGERDQRFADEAWRTIPSFRMLGQSYRLFELWMNRMQESVDGSWQDKARARFAADVISAALSPTNYLGTNPAALREAIETSGLSLVKGAQNMMRDLARGGMPSMVDRKQFTVGKDLAATPGAVVYRDEMFELLQYTPTTPKVRAIPVLMFPPQINRHYILDLSPERSLVEFAVSQGIGVFMVVWRNPSSLRGDGKWGLDDYIAAAERAAEVVKKIARTDQLNMLGLCAGGITVSYVLAHLAAIGDDSAKSATFVVTMLTGEKPNVVGMLDTAESRKVLEKAAADGTDRPRDRAAQPVRHAAAERPGLQLPGQRMAHGQVACPVRRPGVERRRDPDYGQVRVRVKSAVHGRMGRQRADAARRQDRLQQGHLRQLPRRRLHRPHHGVAGLLRHRPAGRRRR